MLNETLIAGVVIAVLVLVGIYLLVMRQREKSRIEEIMNKRKQESILSHRGIFVEGREKLPVALSLTRKSVLYENEDLQARLDLDTIDEVEYDDETITGLEQEGHRVIRLRSHGNSFEFMVTAAEAAEWEEHLPQHHLDEPGKVQAI
jgi:hypothetical protein